MALHKDIFQEDGDMKARTYHHSCLSQPGVNFMPRCADPDGRDDVRARCLQATLAGK